MLGKIVRFSPAFWVHFADLRKRVLNINFLSQSFFRLSLLFVLLFGVLQGNATHLAGGEILYRCVGKQGSSFLYEVKVVTYRDCGSSFDPNGTNVLNDLNSSHTTGGVPNLTVSNGCGFTNPTSNYTGTPSNSYSFKLINFGGTEVTQTCTSSPTTCQGGSLPGIEKFEYVDTLALDSGCSSWRLNFFEVNRNTAVNIASLSSEAFYVDALVSTDGVSCNESPEFIADPTAFYCQNDTVFYSYNCVDADNDSLRFELISARGALQNFFPTRFINPIDLTNQYNSGFTGTKPINTMFFQGTSSYINRSTGDISFAPNTQGEFVLVVKVTEYDRASGVEKGYIVRDFQITIASPGVCSANSPPTVSSPGVFDLTGLGNIIDSNTISTTPSADTLCFSFAMKDDVNTGDSIFYNSNLASVLGNGAFITAKGSNPDTGRICWPLNGISQLPNPRELTITGIDDGCPFGRQTSFRVSINVNSAVSTNGFTQQDESCPGLGDGFLIATPDGGVGPFTYQWYKGLNSTTVIAGISSDSFPSPEAGQPYRYRVTDQATGVTSGFSNYGFFLANSGIIVSSDTILRPNCTDFCGTEIEILTITGGNVSPDTVTSYKFQWRDAAKTLVDTTNHPMGLCPGSYSVRIEDENGCDSVYSYFLSTPATFEADFTDSTNVFCRGESTGSLTLSGREATCGIIETVCAPADLKVDTIESGSLSFNFNAFPSAFPNGSPKTRQQFLYRASELQAIGMTSGKISAIDFFVSGFPATISSYSVGMVCTTEDSLNDWASGINAVYDSKSTSATSGIWNSLSFDRSFQWDGSSNIIIELCTELVGTSVNLPTRMSTTSFPSSLTYSSDTSDACGQSVISPNNITIGGTPYTINNFQRPDIIFRYCDVNYTFNWTHDGALTDSIANNLPAGTYLGIVTNQDGCKDSTSATIEQPDSTFRFIFSDSIPLVCFGDTNGQMTVTPLHGQSPYNYTWNPTVITSPTADSVATNLRAGVNYAVEVTDSNSCVANDTISVGERPQLDPVHSILQNIVCAGDTHGIVRITPTTGIGPFTYQWSPAVIFGAGGDSVGINVNGGVTYKITVTDGNGCIDSTSFALPAPLGILPTQAFEIDQPCFGDTIGVSAIVPTNGLSPFNYTWPAGVIHIDNGDSTRATNLRAGIDYKVYVTDANTCQDSITVNVDEPPLLTASFIDSTDALCFGASNGTARMTINGGTTPYNYTWEHDAGVNDSISNNLPAGRWTVTVTDNNGCSTEDSVNIDQPGASMVATINLVEDVSCFGLSDGTIGAQVTGGTRPYNYSWNGAPANQTDSILNNQSAGQFIVSVTDNLGCSFSDTAIINQPTQLQVSIAEVIQPSCFGFNNGLVRVTPNGGTKPYTYQWNDPSNQTDSVANGLLGSVAGITYKVILRDSANRCADSTTQTITSPTQLTITKADSTNVLCFGQGTGAARIIASNGTSPYSYLWNPGSSTDSLISGVTSGVYKVVVSDNNNCSDSVNFNLEQPDNPLTGFFFNVDSVSCNGLTDGSATYSARGGTSPYDYTWSAGSGVGNPTDSTTNNLPFGEIRITVTDANSCPQILDTAIIAEPTPIVASIVSTTPAGCSGATNGTATVRASGGFGSFVYEWSAGTGSLNDTTTTGLAAGPISVIVRSANDTTCKVTVADVIVDNAPIGLVVDSVANPTCNGLSDGFISVHGTGGYGVYVYSWSHNVGLVDSSASNLPFGFYAISVTDTGGCPQADTIILLSQPLALSLNKVDSTNVSCFGNNDGKAKVFVSGGTTPYTYTWNTTPPQTTDSAVNLFAGIIQVVVADSNACSDSIQFNIEQPAASVFTTTSVISNPSCFGFADGSAKVSPTGGTIPYNYVWNHNGTLNDSLATGLDSGTYIVEVFDAKGCSAGNDTIIVTEPLPITATLQIDSNVSCFGLSDGGMSVVGVSGGTAPYRYLWSGGTAPLNDSIITGLSIGGYAVTVTDTNGCFIVLTDTIVEPTKLVTSLVTPPIIPGFSYIGERNEQYVYFSASFLTWDAARQACLNVGGDLLVIEDTADNNYFSSIFPASSWIGLYQDTASPTYSEPSGGWFWVDGNPLTFSNWNTNEPNNFFGAANPENHGQFVNSGFWNDIPGTDNYQFGMVINKGSFDSQNATCNGLNDGFASFSAGGGVPPYSYAWSNGDLDSLAQNLDSGIYVITITDANNCELLDTAIITEPDLLVATIADSSDESCVGANDGSSRVVWSGGNGTISYLWSNGDLDSTAENLTAGNYGVRVQDFKGCKDSVSVSIGAADTINISMTKLADNLCFGEANGIVKANASGGSGALTYAWSSGTITNDTLASNLTAGFVRVTVTDQNLCESIDSIEVTQPTQIVINEILDTVPTCLDTNGQITVNVTGGIQFGNLPYRYYWLNQTLDTLSPQPTDSVASNLFAQSYNIVVEDSNGCVNQKLIPLTSLDGPTISLDTIIDAICDNDSTGSIQISVFGNGPFTYLWLPDSQVVEDPVLLDSGQYTVQVTDTNDCPAFQTYNLSDGDRYGISMLSNQVLCFGDSNGFAVATPFGTSGPYSYSWNKGNVFVPTVPPIPIDSVRQDLPPGFVSVTITNGQGCAQTDSVFVAEPTPIQDTILVTNTLDCFGDANAAVVARTEGGTAPYFYTWSNGPAIPTLHDSIRTNLTAGKYFVTITDTSNCTTIDSVIVTQPDSISIISTGFSDISCFGASDGMFSIAAFGGTNPLIFSWSAGNGGASDTVSQLIDTTFASVTVTDVNGCPSKTLNQNLVEPNAISVSLIKDDVRCFNEINGSVVAIPSGGNGGYVYSWSAGTGGLNDSITSGLDTGKVTLSITDIFGCPPALDSVNINQPDTFIATINKFSDVSCYGFTDGSANVTFTGGNGNVLYTWDDPASQGDSTAINLAVDTFTVTIVDNRGCVAIDEVIISEPDSIEIQFSNINHPSCFGFGDGSVTANVTGGIKPYTYNWTFGAAGTSDSVNTGLFDGSVTLNLVDSNTCLKSETVDLVEPLEMTTIFTIDSFPLCGQNNGGISVTISGGTPFSGGNYYLQWLNATKSPLVPNQTDSVAINLAQGFYYLAISDSNGCVDTSNQGLNALDGPVVYTDSLKNPTCVGFSDGAIFVSDSSGTGPLTYSWSPGGAATQDITGLTQGIYSLTVTDSIGCQAFEVRNLFDPLPVSIAFVDTILESCIGNDGSIRAIVSGGNDPYNYTWSNGQSGTNDTIAINLDYGIIGLTVTDSVGCQALDSAQIDSVPSLSAFVSDSVGATCFGGANGSATVSVSGGVEPYNYIWSSGSGGSSDSTSNGLSAGLVSVTISDTQGCPPLVLNQNIGEGAEYVNSIDTILANCGANNGGLIANISGGNPPYNLLWLDATKNSIGNTNDTILGLAAGSYFLAVSDSFGCPDTIQTNLNSIGGPSISLNTLTNTTANGLCNGGIDVNVVASGAPISSYAWSPGGDTTEDISNKCAGVYTLTVTDAAGCISIFSDTITEPPVGPALTVISGFDPTDCDTNICTGRVFTNPISGTPPFSYSWSSGVNDTLFEVNNLCAGSYIVTISDSLGNSIADTIEIPVRDFIQSVSASITDVTCFGDSNGVIDLSIVGGVGPYNYQWAHNSSLNSDSVFGLAADTFVVTITENGGCSFMDSISVESPDPISVILAPAAALCNQSNGNILAVPSGGTSPYNYDWLNASKNSLGLTNSPTTGSVLSAGLYYLAISDSVGCIDTFSTSLSNNSAPTITLDSLKNTSFPGICDGEINVTINPFGTTPIDSIVWSPTGDTTEDISNLCDGVYTLEVTDTNGCKAFYTDTIFDPPGASPLAVLFIVDTSDCNPANCNGKVKAIVSGGYTPYTYTWANSPTPSTIDSITGLCSGFYAVTISDSIGTILIDSAFVPAFDAINAVTATITEPSCPNSLDGQILVQANGGTLPYSFQWSHNLALNDSLATNLTSGNYSVTITEAGGCSLSDTIVLGAPPVINLSFDTLQPGCTANNGRIVASVSGGKPIFGIGYNYNWLDNNQQPFVPAQTNDTLLGVAAGLYFVVISDSTCTDTFQVDLINSGGPSVSLDLLTDPTCFGGSDGSIQVSTIGGTAPYQYNWIPGNFSAEDIFSLNSGIYTLQVTDTNNCVGFYTDTINDPLQIQTNTSKISDALCFGDNNGEANVVVTSGGFGNISYQWTSGSTSPSVNDLTPGKNYVTVTDQNLCFVIDSITIGQPNQLVIDSVSDVQPTCNVSNGSLTANISGGTSPYRYLWDGIAGLQTLSFVGAGLYNLQVIDTNNCSVSTNVSLSNDVGPTFSLASKETDCFGSCDGELYLSNISGTGPFSINWPSLTSNLDTILGVCVGNYGVEVTDANNCITTDTITVSEPTQISGAPTVFNFPTCGNSNGKVIVQNIAGGTPGLTGYSYVWLDGSKDTINPINSTDSLINVASGVYYFRVSDSLNCFEDIQVNLPNTGAPSITLVSLNDASCVGSSTGGIDVDISGGSLPYNFLWLPDSVTSEDRNNLQAGTYTIQVTDGSSCKNFANYTINNQGSISGTPVVLSNLSCFNTADGSATVNMTGAVAPLFYSWSNGESLDTATSLPSGIVGVTVTDGVGCQFDTVVNIGAPPSINIDSTVITQPNCGQSNGVIFVAASGGTGTLNYLWSNNQTIPGANNLGSGLYSVTITDQNNCSIDQQIPLSDLGAPVISKKVNDALCFSSCNGNAKIDIISGTQPITYNWPTIFNLSDTAFGLCAGIYPIEVTDSLGCLTIDTVVVDEPDSITVTFSKILPNCSQANGSITANVNGGSPFSSGYTLLWTNINGNVVTPVNTSLILNNVPSGVYNIVVADSNSCGGTFPATLPNNPGPTVTLDSIIDASCSGVCDGEIFISATGVGNLTYLWNPSGLTTKDASGLCAGTFFVQVTDSNSCKAVNSYQIKNDVTLNSVINILQPITCASICDASAITNVIGAAGTIQYNWSNGEQTATAIALCPGVNYVTITDAGGCSIVDSVTIQGINPIVINNTNITQPACGNCNGSIVVNATGGIGILNYVWSNGGGFPSIGSLCAGTYNVSIFDNNGCFVTQNVPLSNSNGASYNISSSDISCKGSSDGTAQVFNLNGTAPFTAFWPQVNQTGLSVSGLSAGNYSVEVTDSTGCVTIDSITINEPAAISTTFVINEPLCGNTDGSISAAVSGGTIGVNGYLYFWLDNNLDPIIPFQNTPIAVNLAAGDYNLRVTDSLGCQEVIPISLGNSDGPSIILESLFHATCDGLCDGAINTRIVGNGVSIEWLPSGDTLEDISNLCPGIYTVKATDQNGCISTETFEIFGPSALSALITSKQNASCLNSNDGVIEITLFGGNTPLNYLWNGPKGFNATLEDVTNLFPGEYGVLITDNNGCKDSIGTELFATTELFVNAGNDTLICEGISPIQLITEISPDNAQSISWIDDFGNVLGSNDTIAVPTRPGRVLYFVSAQLNNCLTIDTLVVNTSPFDSVDAGPDRTIIEGQTITLGGNPTGPKGSSFAWEPFFDVSNESASNPIATPLDSTTYIVTVIGEGGCRGVDSVRIKVEPAFEINDGFSPNGDGVNDTWTIPILQDYPLAEVEVYNRWGQLLYKSAVPYVAWDGTFEGNELPIGTYYYAVILNDGSNDKPITGTVTIIK